MPRGRQISSEIERPVDAGYRWLVAKHRDARNSKDYLTGCRAMYGQFLGMTEQQVRGLLLQTFNAGTPAGRRLRRNEPKATTDDG